MSLDPPDLFMLAVLVAVTGYVAKGLMTTWYRLSRGEQATAARPDDTEDRLRKLEAATSSLLVDVHGMREKERFMARLHAGAAPFETAQRTEVRKEGDVSPMVTQNIPIVPRKGPRA